MVQRYSKSGCRATYDIGKVPQPPDMKQRSYNNSPPPLSTCCIGSLLFALLQAAWGRCRSCIVCSSSFDRNLCPHPTQLESAWLALMTVHPWLMSHYAMALSPCLNKLRGLKHFAKLEPDPGPSWALSGHTNHGIRLYSPTNAQKSQSSISKTSVDSNRCMWSSKSFWKEQFRRYHRHKQSDFYHG